MEEIDGIECVSPRSTRGPGSTDVKEGQWHAESKPRCIFSSSMASKEEEAMDRQRIRYMMKSARLPLP